MHCGHILTQTPLGSDMKMTDRGDGADQNKTERDEQGEDIGLPSAKQTGKQNRGEINKENVKDTFKLTPNM